jgi:hypothetical protein
MTVTSASIPQELYTSYSADREAVADFHEWSARHGQIPLWRRRERKEAQTKIADARRRCVAAGVDWGMLPKPEPGLCPPNRTHRKPVGKSTTIAQEIEQAGRRASEETSNGPATPSVSGIGVAAVAGGAAGAFAASYIAQHSLESLHQEPDGSGWFASPDGGVWFADATGGVFAFAGTSFYALGADGYLYGLAADGALVTWAADGTTLTPGPDGYLHTQDAAGNDLIVGEDGSFYMSGADGSFYTMGSDGSFYGVDEHGSYFAAGEGSGYAPSDFGGAADEGSGGSLLELFG